jgi:toxin YoeB
MSKEIVFKNRGWSDYLYWQKQDKKTLNKINRLLSDIERGNKTGKAELLKYGWSGWLSVRIDDVNRIVYRIHDGKLEIAQCKGHYNDK